MIIRIPVALNEAGDKQFTNPILNKKIQYVDKDGEKKENLVGNLLRLPKNHPGRLAAEKMLPKPGTVQRKSVNRVLGKEKDGKMQMGTPKITSKDKEDQPTQPQQPKQPNTQQLFKSDPASIARLDKEKEINKKLAGDDDTINLKSLIPNNNSNVKTTKKANFKDFLSNELEKWKENKESIVSNIEETNIKKQSKWVNSMSPDTLNKYSQLFGAWQATAEKSALNKIDKLLQTENIPKFETTEPIYRGISLNKKDLDKMLNDFSKNSNIKIPIGSFSTSLDVSTQFATDTDDKQFSVIFRVKSQCNKINGLFLNSHGEANNHRLKELTRVFGYEHEILMPSNQKYNIDKINNISFDELYDNVNSMTIVDLIQECSQDENFDDNLSDLSDTTFYKQIFQTHQRK